MQAGALQVLWSAADRALVKKLHDPVKHWFTVPQRCRKRQQYADVAHIGKVSRFDAAAALSDALGQVAAIVDADTRIGCAVQES